MPNLSTPIALLAPRLQTVRWELSVVRAGLVPCVLSAALALSLGGCAKRDPAVTMADAERAGSWRIERQVDRTTGAPISSARTATDRSSNSMVALPQLAGLQLTCFKEQPIARFEFLFKVGSNRNSELSYRFDDKPGRNADARFLQDRKTVVIEDKAAVAQFAADLANSKMLYVFIRSLNAGRSSAEFRVTGATAALEAGFASCPLTPVQPRPRTSALPTRGPTT